MTQSWFLAFKFFDSLLLALLICWGFVVAYELVTPGADDG